VKSAGVADVLRAALAGLADRTAGAFLYGSLAKGADKASSDGDLMVVGEVTVAEGGGARGPAQERVGREINPAVYPPAEWRRKLAQGHHFLTAVLKEPKIFLLGGADELARLAEERLVDATADQPARDPRSSRRRRS